MRYVVKVMTRRVDDNKLLEVDMYVNALQYDPYVHHEAIGTRAHFSEYQDEAFRFKSRAAAEVIACTVGGRVVILRSKKV